MEAVRGMGDGANIGSCGQRHDVRSATAGRGLRVLTADANGRPDHVSDSRQLGHQEHARRPLEWPHIDDRFHRPHGHNIDHPHEHLDVDDRFHRPHRHNTYHPH